MRATGAQARRPPARRYRSCRARGRAGLWGVGYRWQTSVRTGRVMKEMMSVRGGGEWGWGVGVGGGVGDWRAGQRRGAAVEAGAACSGRARRRCTEQLRGCTLAKHAFMPASPLCAQELATLPGPAATHPGFAAPAPATPPG